MERFLTSNSSNEISEKRYRCVTCLHPCESLYCQYGKTLKLNRCLICRQATDPYCEREWLLIVSDLILLRQEAYRHVLCNEKWVDMKFEYVHYLDYCFKYFIACCIEPVFRHLQSFDRSSETNESIDDISFNLPVGFLNQLSRSILGSFVSVSTILILSLYVVKYNGEIKDNSKQISRMIFKSIIWPLFGCQIATCLVTIWDNSKVTRIIGFIILPFIYQWMALYQTILVTCVHPNLRDFKQTRFNVLIRVMTTSCVLLLAFAAKIIIVALLITCSSGYQDEINSGGLEWSLTLGSTSAYRICLI